MIANHPTPPKSTRQRVIAVLAAAVIAATALACDQTPDWSAADQPITERDKAFNACISRLWDGLDWEGSDRTVAWGTAIGMYCLEEIRDGYWQPPQGGD